MIETILKGAILAVSSLIALIIIICMIANSKKRKKKKNEKNMQSSESLPVAKEENNALQTKDDPFLINTIESEISKVEAVDDSSNFELEDIDSLSDDSENEDNSNFELESVDSLNEGLENDDNFDFELDTIDSTSQETIVENITESASEINLVEENNQSNNNFARYPTMTEFFDEDGVVLIGRGDSRVTGTYGFLPAGEYYVESVEGIEVFKIRTGRNVREYRNGDIIVLVDRHKVVPISSAIIIKQKL